MKKITDTCYLTDDEEYACTEIDNREYAIVSKGLCNTDYHGYIVSRCDTLDEAKVWLEGHDAMESEIWPNNFKKMLERTTDPRVRDKLVKQIKILEDICEGKRTEKE